MEFFLGFVSGLAAETTAIAVLAGFIWTYVRALLLGICAGLGQAAAVGIVLFEIGRWR